MIVDKMVLLIILGGHLINYPVVAYAIFIERPNRFVARCRLKETDEEITVHVKNTGRCKELLISGVEVGLAYSDNPKRKTAYDLVSVQKNGRWVNIDSQIPNDLVALGLKTGRIELPDVSGKITHIEREKTFGHSRFDFYLETADHEKIIVEVKGLTLEHNGLGAFPDAPSARAIKHVKHLGELMKEGYKGYLLFVIQLSGVASFTIAQTIDSKFYEEVVNQMNQGLKIVGYDCVVTGDRIELNAPVPFDIRQKF